MYRKKWNNDGKRQNAKELCRNRYKVLDEDIGSQYDNIIEEEEESAVTAENPLFFQGVWNRSSLNRMQQVKKPSSYVTYEAKKAQQNSKAAATGSRDIVFKCRVRNGEKYGLRFVLKSLIQYVENLRPILPQIAEDGNIEFFVKDEDAAQAVKLCTRRIRHPQSGERLIFWYDRMPAPWPKLKREDISAIQDVVDERSNPNRTLDLHNFHTAAKFLAKDMHMMLSKNNVMLAVVEHIESKYANIIALSLKGNRLKYLDCLSMLTYVTKQLSVLDLSDNQIESARELEKLRGLRITSIFLENNPFCEEYTRASDYLRHLENLLLDGNECDALPNADDDDKDMVEPPALPGFYGTDELRVIVERFLTEYFVGYDGEEPAKRKNLIAAYDDDHSTFTLTIDNLEDIGAGGKQRPGWPNENFMQYLRTSHNISQIDKWERYRAGRICRGAMEIAAQLAKFPATRHLMESFIVDVSLKTNTLLCFSVQGLYEESPFAKSAQIPKLIFFSRNFVVSARPNGAVAVLSDQLFLSAVTSERVEGYRMQLKRANTNSAPVNVVADPGPSMAAVEPDLATKQVMVQQFCIQSGMLPEWSEKCLVDSGWNFEEKLEKMFSELGKVTSCAVMTDLDGKSKGFGFVAFEEAESVEKLAMTTAHRPTFNPARGGTGRTEGDLSKLSQQYSSKDMPSHKTLKYRQKGQGTADDLSRRDLRRELEDKERSAARERRSGKEGGSSSSASKRPRFDDLSSGTAVDADEPLDDVDDYEDSEDDETAALQAELAKIRKERMAEKAKKEEEEEKEQERIRKQNILHGNPLLNLSATTGEDGFKVKRRWDDDVVFKNCAKGLEDKKKDATFINDAIRSEFHKKFMEKYVK